MTPSNPTKMSKTRILRRKKSVPEQEEREEPRIMTFTDKKTPIHYFLRDTMLLLGRRRKQGGTVVAAAWYSDKTAKFGKITSSSKSSLKANEAVRNRCEHAKYTDRKSIRKYIFLSPVKWKKAPKILKERKKYFLHAQIPVGERHCWVQSM